MRLLCFGSLKITKISAYLLIIWRKTWLSVYKQYHQPSSSGFAKQKLRGNDQMQSCLSNVATSSTSTVIIHNDVFWVCAPVKSTGNLLIWGRDATTSSMDTFDITKKELFFYFLIFVVVEVFNFDIRTRWPSSEQKGFFFLNSIVMHRFLLSLCFSNKTPQKLTITFTQI